MALVVDKQFVEDFQKIFSKAFYLFQSYFTPITLKNEAGEDQEFIKIEQDNKFNFVPFFLDHKKGLAQKYEVLELAPNFGLTVTPELISEQLELEISALKLHQEYLRQLGLQKYRAINPEAAPETVEA